MPFNPDRPPVGKINGLGKLSKAKQRQWVHVFNSALDKGDSEETAIKKAWGTVKKASTVMTSINEKLMDGFKKTADETKNRIYVSTEGLTPKQLKAQMAAIRSADQENTLSGFAKGFLGLKRAPIATHNNTPTVTHEGVPGAGRGIQVNNLPGGFRGNRVIYTSGPKNQPGVTPAFIQKGFLNKLIRNIFVRPFITR